MANEKEAMAAISLYYRTNRTFCRIVYHAHMTPSLFPHEAGIPLRHSYWFETPPFIWQTYMLVEMMNVPLHVTFSFHQLYERMRYFIRQNLIHIRRLPLVTKSHYSYALMDYLHALVSLRFLKKSEKVRFSAFGHGRFRATLKKRFVEMSNYCDEL